MLQRLELCIQQGCKLRGTWHQGTKAPEHGPAPVQDLIVEVAVKVGRLLRQRSGVIAIVAWRGPSQVLWVAVLYGAQPLGPLWPIPHAAEYRVSACVLQKCLPFSTCARSSMGHSTCLHGVCSIIVPQSVIDRPCCSTA